MRFLILEDDESMIKLYRHWLTKINVEADSCSSGKDAISKHFKDKNHNFDLIIADLQLEDEKSGDQVISLLKSLEVSSKEKTPVLFLSANIKQELRTKYKKEKHIKFMDKKNIGYLNQLQLTLATTFYVSKQRVFCGLLLSQTPLRQSM